MSHVFAASHNLALHEVVESPRLQKQFVLLITAALLFEHHTACGEQRFTALLAFCGQTAIQRIQDMHFLLSVLDGSSAGIAPTGHSFAQ